jgi:hypothetical protein
MKSFKINALVAFLLLISASCTKERLYVSEVENVIPFNNYPGFCYNGYWDSGYGELSIDCGGPCAPCQALVPTCVVDDNSFLIGTTSKIPNSGVAEVITTTGGDRYKMSGTVVGGGSYTIIFGTDSPVDYTYYTITNTSNQNNMESDEVLVTVAPSGMFLNACIEGKVYFRQDGGDIYATICDAVAWSSGMSAQGYSIKGHVTCQ